MMKQKIPRKIIKIILMIKSRIKILKKKNLKNKKMNQLILF